MTRFYVYFDKSNQMRTYHNKDDLTDKQIVPIIDMNAGIKKGASVHAHWFAASNVALTGDDAKHEASDAGFDGTATMTAKPSAAALALAAITASSEEIAHSVVSETLARKPERRNFQMPSITMTNVYGC